jgi:hypothetical protein
MTVALTAMASTLRPMSIPVALLDLPSVAQTRPFAYLLTSKADGRPHGVAVTPDFVDGAMVTEAGRTTCRNAVERPLVSLIYPPVEPGGYSLIVDATASVVGEVVRLTATHAVLHRPAVADGPALKDGCRADCAPVTLDIPK